ADPPSGCKFRTRCFRYAALGEADQARCREVSPELTQKSSDHRFACHFPVPVPGETEASASV
ncbi:hypothetical protein, partial [Sedimentibacter sp. B4]|uniref:hypothetical protein n=1 Tax=Sedimentibacter sp. B4 TaxID=304766 RepID=UPI001E449AEE